MATLKRIALAVSNTAIMVMWGKVLYVIISAGWQRLADAADDTCIQKLHSTLLQALAVSCIELMTSLVGLTRSNPVQVLLFSTVRAGVEVLVSPLIPCGSWQHLLTAFCWAFGDVIRFGCFAVDSVAPGAGSVVKSIRYTVGPIMFPFGASGEMLMVIKAASDGSRPGMYIAAALWPAGFYPLMRQLLKQRRKHFQGQAQLKVD